MKTLGQYLKACREKTGETQLNVAHYLGYNSPQFISNVERSICGPALETVEAWCGYVGANRKLVLKLMVETYEEKVAESLKGGRVRNARPKIPKLCRGRKNRR